MINLINDDIVINCQTHKESIDYLTLLDRMGFTWYDDSNLMDKSNRHYITSKQYQTDTCFRIDKDKKLVFTHNKNYYLTQMSKTVNTYKSILDINENPELLLTDRELLLEIYRMLKINEESNQIKTTPLE